MFMEVTRNGFDNSHHPDNSASWHCAQMAPQQKLGLWTKRRGGTPAGDRPDPAADGLF